MGEKTSLKWLKKEFIKKVIKDSEHKNSIVIKRYKIKIRTLGSESFLDGTPD